MRYIILGAGAIGCYVGGRLAHAGHTVCFVGRSRVLQPLSEQGLRVVGNDGLDALIPPAQICLAATLQEAVGKLAAKSGRPSQNDNALVVLVCVKTTATDEAALDIAAHCPAGTTVVSLQNGVDNAARLIAGAPTMTVLASVVAFNVVWRDANQVYQTNNGNLLVQQDPTSEVFSPVFRQAGVPVDLYRDMAAVKWGKLLLNLINPVNALANISLREMFMQRDLRRVAAALMDEGLRVLNAAGIRPAQIGDAPPAKLFAIALRLPNWLFLCLARKIMRMDPVARASMCDDLQQGKPTEVDDLCGAVVRLGQRYGVATPSNQAMCNLIHQFQPGQQCSGQDLLAALDMKR